MKRYRLVIRGDGPVEQQPLALDAPSILLALKVAEINMQGGTAEIWQGEKRVARMRRRRGSGQFYWELA